MQVFFCEFCDIFKNTFFTEHLWATGSVYCICDFVQWFYSVLLPVTQVVFTWSNLTIKTLEQGVKYVES